MASVSSNYDVVIVGGGVIGLSLAWELGQHGVKVCVLDRGPLGREASWAGAGMVPPGPLAPHWDVATPYEQFAGLSQLLHGQWHHQLLELTGIDNEYRRSGSIELAFNAAEVTKLESDLIRNQQLGIEHQQLTATELTKREPALARLPEQDARADFLPTAAQIRNPRHLQALAAACQSVGVDLCPNVEVRDFQTQENRLYCAVTREGSINAEHFCLTAGSWSGELAMKLNLQLGIRPIRGQIVLLRGTPDLIQRTINVGPRYLVSRQDGRILVGSTQEDAGFEKTTTAAGINELLQFAASLSPRLAQLPVEHRWAGLRPGTKDGFPYIGRVPELENAWLATGHFRVGLQLSPATAVVLRSLILGQEPPIDPKAFAIDR